MKRHRAELHPAGLDLREVQHLVDHAQEVFAARLHDLHALPVAGRELAILHQHLGVADDAVERRAQLVAHVGEKRALRAVGGVGGFLGVAELLGALGHELFQPDAFALRLAQAPAHEPDDRAGQRRDVERDRRPAAVPGRGDAEEHPRGLAREAVGVDRAHLEGEGAAGEVGEYGFGAG